MLHSEQSFRVGVRAARRLADFAAVSLDLNRRDSLVFFASENLLEVPAAVHAADRALAKFTDAAIRVAK